VVRKRLETVDASRPTDVARLQGRIDALRSLVLAPDEARKGLAVLERKAVKLKECLEVLRRRPEVDWFERHVETRP